MKLYKIKKSNIDNKGLYASEDIKDRTKIIEYKGKILTKKQVEKNAQEKSVPHPMPSEKQSSRTRGHTGFILLPLRG